MVRIGLVGCGQWGLNYLKTFSTISAARITHVCDLNEVILREIKFLYPHTKTFTDYRYLMESNNLDGVIIATPPKLHFPIAAEFLLSKKAVLLEKPATLSYVDAKKLVELAQMNSVTLMVGHLMEYHPAVVQLHSYISQGMLGELRYILTKRAHLGSVRNDVSVLWDLAVHDLSIVRYLVNQEPLWVSAQGESYLKAGIQDLITITMGFSGNLFTQIHANWLYPLKQRQLVLAGDKMMAVMDDAKEDYKVKLIPFEGDLIMPRLEKTPPLTGQCLHFIECIKTHVEPKTGARDIFWVIRVMELIELSLASNSARFTLEKKSIK